MDFSWIFTFFYEDILPGILVLGIGIVAFGLLARSARRHYQRKDYRERADKWREITQATNTLVTECPTEKELHEDFALHSLDLPMQNTAYEHKFEVIMAQLDSAHSRHAREQAKYIDFIPETFQSLVDSYNEHLAIVTIYRTCLSDLQTLWKEIDSKSGVITQSTTLNALEELVFSAPLPRVRNRESLNDPLIYDSGMGADYINSMFLRSVYREPYPHEDE